MNRIKANRQKRADWVLAIAIFALVLFGLVAIYSVSKYYSLQITDSDTDKYYLLRQVLWVGIGLVAWIIMQIIDYKFWQKNTNIMLYITLILLILPLFFGDSHGSSASRWIGFGSYSFQPAELAKLTFTMYLAGWLSHRVDNREIEKSSIHFFAAMFGLAFLMLLQKDLGTLGIFVGIAGAMYFMSGAPLKHIVSGGALSSVLVWIAIKIEPYRLQRLTTFLNPEGDLLGSGYHIQNALIAIGSGGIWGLGFGQSKQKYLYVPEAHTDSIFAIISEELGLLRSSLIIVIIAIIASCGYRISKNAPDTYGRLLAIGITTWFVWQSFVNIAAMLAMVPLTGVPLPFISYGGSSLLFLMMATGVLLNISKYSTEKK